ncbi:MAG: L,D-transpeptidase [Rhizobiaceae bacterium]
MLSKTFTMILVGASVAFAAPVAAIAEPVAPPPPAAEAQVVNVALAKTGETAPVKKTAKKSTNKKKKAAAKAEPAPEPKKPGGLFGALFGGPVKKEEPAKPTTKAEKAKAAKAAKAAAAAEQAEKAKAVKAAKAAEAAEKAEKAKAVKAAAAAKRAEQERLAKIEAEKARAEEEAIRATAANAKGNSGELRSETAEVKPQGFFEAVFGGPQQKVALLEETKALDAALTIKDRKAKFRVTPEFEPQRVEFSGYKRGQIVIDPNARFLYLIESGSSARRYAIAVGKDGLQFKGTVTVGDKQEWPRWIPTKEMQARNPAKYGRYKEGMDGGTENPLGARAIYLYQGKKDTHLRIHGTTEPQSIGTSASNGCFRMINEHVIELYSRVKKGTEVIVL